MSDETKQKLSHRKWRQHQKKLRRKLKRQETARQDNDLKEQSEVEEDVDIYEDAREKSLRLLAEEQWLERERLAQMEFAEKKRKAELEKKKREEEEQRIKREWEERERREQEEEKKRQEAMKKRRERQVPWMIATKMKRRIANTISERLLKEATANENKPGEGGAWSNPLAPRQLPGVERKVDKCPFFTKTAACRFGDRCSRLHDVPDTSPTIVFPGMYSHYSLDQALRGEYDIDIDLEYEDSETTKHFEEFYHDVLPEFRTAGSVVQFKVCRNFEPHLKGNVYVQYTTEEEALRAYALFNARWYGGKQLSGRFAIITSWRQAICGQYHQKKCIKGRGCNFLHVFRNPNSEFRDADTDYGHRTDSVRIHGNTSSRHDRNGRSPSRSMSRSSWRRSRSRDRGSIDRKRRSRSRERTRSRLRSRSRDRTRSRVRSRSRDRTSSRARSKSRDRRTSRARSRDRNSDKSRDNPVSKSRHNRRSRSRSAERRRRSRSRSPRQKRSRQRSKSPIKS